MTGRVNKIECRALRAKGWSLARLAERYGVSEPAVCRACRGVKCPVDHGGRGFRAYNRGRAHEVAAQRELIQSLFVAGRHPKQIAYEADVSLGKVYYHLPSIKSPAARALRGEAHPCA